MRGAQFNNPEGVPYSLEQWRVGHAVVTTQVAILRV